MIRISPICRKSKSSDRWNWLQVLQTNSKIMIIFGIWHNIKSFIPLTSMSNIAYFFLIDHAFLIPQDKPLDFPCPSSVPSSYPKTSPHRPCLSIYFTHPFYCSSPFLFFVLLYSRIELSSLRPSLFPFGSDSCMSFEPPISFFPFASFTSATVHLQAQQFKIMTWLSLFSLLHLFFAIMAWSEDCLHCADLQAKLEQIRAHQNILDAKIDSQNRIVKKKYQVDSNMFLHRVSSLHKRFNHLSNRCSHAEESIEILKYMMDKRNAAAPSSSSTKQISVDDNPEESMVRHINHIDIG